MKATRFFTLPEMLNSDTAIKKGISNTPSFVIVGNLYELITMILDPIRAAWGSGLKINSGYRCPALNKTVKGVDKSAHMYGYAADVVPVNGKLDEFIKFAEKYLKDHNIKFDQSIREEVGGAKWWHIAIRRYDGSQRKKFLIIKG